ESLTAKAKAAAATAELARAGVDKIGPIITGVLGVLKVVRTVNDFRRAKAARKPRKVDKKRPDKG
ncbi:hypothetical protein ACSTJV_24130, partial [Vibrio parahaemolyticus]